MSPRILGIFLITSVLDQLYLVDGTNGLQESPSSDLNLESTIRELNLKLDYCKIQLQIKDEHNKEKIEQMETIYKLKSQLAVNEISCAKEKEMAAAINNLNMRLVNAEQQLKFKDDLIQEKVKEIQDCDLIKTKDKQILEQSEKVNFMTVTISNLQSQLAKSRDDVKVKIKDINDRTEEVKIRDDIIKSKEKEISDKSEQLKNIEGKITVKDNELENLSAQISTKDNEIDSLNNQTKHDLEKITEMTDELHTCREWESCPTGRPDGVYKINKPGIAVFEAPCNSNGWMTIQRRQDGSVDFNLNWVNYKNGFGNLTGELFIGLEKLHQMTKDKPHELYIKLMKFNGESAYAHYDNFQIGSELEFYKLKSLGTCSGTTGDSLRYSEGLKFSTIDSDNDGISSNCALSHSGAWWYNNCSYSRLNGKYLRGSTGTIIWHGFGGNNNLAFTQMMIRPKSAL
ncbi:angiopoietin-related protein 7-like [Drosophila subpulchrella]|uniref:angiopoietin-related protein 7-like n=1 Tax=Drosophila subpulchrella TaxID=1486046 RepID=UPI0018A1B3F2|nr:angiopoietin-related protein 7-like [Drosophila subpulchrella]XP_037707302.1 angiopoietin-related protein 7-like [Drosophila subpulchrella]